MKPIIIILSGYRNSGRKTFIKITESLYPGEVVSYSTVSTVKEIAKHLGWNGDLSVENQDRLSTLKDFYSEWCNGTYNEVIGLIQSVAQQKSAPSQTKPRFIILQMKEAHEMFAVTDWCKENGYEHHTVFIMRDCVEDGEHHGVADKRSKMMIYNQYVANNGTLEQFRENVTVLLESIDSGDMEVWEEYVCECG